MGLARGPASCAQLGGCIAAEARDRTQKREGDALERPRRAGESDLVGEHRTEHREAKQGGLALLVELLSLGQREELTTTTE